MPGMHGSAEPARRCGGLHPGPPVAEAMGRQWRPRPRPGARLGGHGDGGRPLHRRARASPRNRRNRDSARSWGLDRSRERPAASGGDLGFTNFRRPGR
jgi:hypothetical protein